MATDSSQGCRHFCAWGDGAVAVHRPCGCPVLDKVADVPFFAATVLGGGRAGNCGVSQLQVLWVCPVLGQGSLRAVTVLR